MTEIIIDIYETDAEISFFSPGSTELFVKFSKPLEGVLNIANKSFHVSDGKCIFKLCTIEDGEYSPNLVVGNMALRLPKLIKDGNRIYPSPYADEYIRNLSKRERCLEARVKELEGVIERLTKSVYGTRLFY